jgi:hypothetical protein
LTWFSWMPQVIGASDAAVVTGINTIPCLRQISEALVQVRSSGTSPLQVAVALNRCERTLIGTIARRKHVERVLQDAQVFYISERAEVIESVNMGIPIMLSDSGTKLQGELAPLGEFCANVTSTHRVLKD